MNIKQFDLMLSSLIDHNNPYNTMWQKDTSQEGKMFTIYFFSKWLSPGMSVQITLQCRFFSHKQHCLSNEMLCLTLELNFNVASELMHGLNFFHFK